MATSTKGTTITSASTPNDEAERLSSDLALFLSNPTLRQGLADGSLDLASYSHTIESELLTLERDCIDVYRTNASLMSNLRQDMDECENILASLTLTLIGFQADLGGLSGDIRALQDQSRTLGVQLRNRRDAELCLRRFLEQVVIPPNLAHVICTKPVNPTFLQCVEELDTKYQYLHMGEGEVDAHTFNTTHFKMAPGSTPAGKEMKDYVTKLRLKAVSRTRTYFLQTIAELRRPKTNVRMIQINSLLKYAPLADFLAKASPPIYKEIRNVYAESMSKTLQALFRTYAAQLSLLDNQIATRKDVLAVEDAALRDVFSSKVNMNKRGDAFHLGDRASVLELALDHQGPSNSNRSGSGGGSTSGNSGPILAHVALAEGKQYAYEVIFKSIMLHLMDAATNEYIFVRQFFKENGPDAFESIFGKTLSLILEQLENYLFQCYDALGLLLMIKLTHSNRRIMKERKVDSLDKFFDSVTSLLWPRLKTVMDRHLRSIRDGDSKKLGVIDLHAHYASRRYAEFTCSILKILNKGNKVLNRHKSNNSTSSMPSMNRLTSNNSFSSLGHAPESRTHERRDSRSSSFSSESRKVEADMGGPTHRGSAGDMLLNDIALLQDETVQLLERLAEDHSTNKKKIVFLINNLDQIISIFQERRVAGRELNSFVDLLMKQRELFVEEELLQNFSKMIAFVVQSEQHMNRAQFTGKAAVEDNKVDINAQVVENLVREFSSTWRQGIEQINQNVLSFFANFRNGMEVLKQVLTQLLLYYTRFQDIIRKVWKSKPPPFCKDLVSTSAILIEIKKYALAI